jgi:aspartate kinase
VATHIKVLKFGGTSVADAAAFQRAADIVRANRSVPVVVVVSAMSGVTDALIKSFRTAATDGPQRAFHTLDEHFERHLNIAQTLKAEALAKHRALIENSRREIRALLDAAGESGIADLRTQDAIASFGELLCANLFSMILERQDVPAAYVDARRCILTDDEHGSANPLFPELFTRTLTELTPFLKQKRVPVLGGFMGATAAGVTTTLGRGSSDYSATLLGAAMRASEIQIWTDVDGVQTADPNVVTTTRTVPMISYQEAAQLAVLGARVMHARMIEPVIADRIPIRIRNSRAPEQDGTLICAGAERPAGVVKAIAHHVNSEHAIVACVGDGLSNGSQGAAKVRRILREIDPALSWHSTAASNLVAVVNRDRVSAIVRQIHERVFEQDHFRLAASAMRSTSFDGEERP